jgi:hypothetical protein
MDLPAPGYPISRDAIGNWFRKRYQREPSSLEVGEIMLQMTRRDSTPPRTGADVGQDPSSPTNGMRGSEGR